MRNTTTKKASRKLDAKQTILWNRFVREAGAYAQIAGFSYLPSARPQHFATWVRIAGVTTLEHTPTGSEEALALFRVLDALRRFDLTTRASRFAPVVEEVAV